MIDDGSRWFGLAVTALVTLGIAAIGLGVLTDAVRRWRQARRLAGAGQRATAVVVENQQRSSSDGQLTFTPVVTFVTTSGQEVRVAVDDLAGHTSHITGTEYDIVYDPEDPGTAMLPTRGTGSVIGAAIFALVLFAVAGLVVRVFAPVLLGTDFGIPGPEWP